MITILFLVAIYLTLAAATTGLGLHMRNNIVPEPVWTNGTWQTSFTTAQKRFREMWECLAVFSIAWPLGLVAGVGYGGYRAVREGWAYLVRISSRKAETVQKRKLDIKYGEKLEELTDRLALAPSGTYDERILQQQIDSLNLLVGAHKVNTQKQLTS